MVMYPSCLKVLNCGNFDMTGVFMLIFKLD
jgi:hypothetical protein